MSVLKEFRDFAVKGNVIDLAVGVQIREVKAALKALPPLPPPTEEQKEKVVGKFAAYKGVTSMTPAQATADDHINKSPRPTDAHKRKGIFVMDPTKPVR